MLIDWTKAFDQQFDRMEADESPDGQRRFDLLVAMLGMLSDLDAPPDEESASLKRVRQSRNYMCAASPTPTCLASLCG